MKHSILIIIFLVKTIYLIAQPSYEWHLSTSGNGDDRVMNTITDAQGNVYVVGAYSSTVDFDPSSSQTSLTAQGLQDGFLAKYSGSGSLMWVRGFGGFGYDEARAVRIDGSGNIIIAGIVNTVGSSQSFQDAICDFYGNGSTPISHPTLGQADVIFAKYNTNGNLLFSKLFGGTKTDLVEDMDVDVLGNIYLTGSFIETIDLDPAIDTLAYTSFNGTFGPTADIFFSKFDNNGNLIFGKRIGGLATDNSLAIECSSNNEFYLLGTFSGQADFDPSSVFNSLQPTNSTDGFLAKYDSIGNFLFVRHIAGASNQYMKDVEADAAGNAIVTGYTQGTMYIDYNTSTCDTINNIGITDAFISKFSASGNLLWAFGIGGLGSENGTGLSLDNSGNIFITGSFNSDSILFGNSSSTHYNLQRITVAPYINNVFFAKYNSNGEIVWARAIGDLTGFVERPRIYFDNSNNSLLLSAITTATALDLDLSINSTTYTTIGNIDGITVSYSLCNIDTSYTQDSLSIQLTAGYANYQWYNCNGNTLITGANQNIYYPSSIGQYQAVITSQDGCIDTTACISVNEVIECIINSNIIQVFDSLKVGETSASYQWVTCPGYNAIAGATNRTYKPVSNNNYACIITKNNGCKDTTSCISFGLGFNSRDNNNAIEIAPNPVSNQVKVTGMVNGNYKFYLISSKGARIDIMTDIENDSYNLNLENIASGLYLIQIEDLLNGFIISKKIIKL